MKEKTQKDAALLEKKIVLINPFPDYGEGINEATIYPPIGLAYLASYLRKNNFANIKIIDANIMRIKNDEIIRQLKKDKPDIVGIHLNVVLGKSGADLSRKVKSQIKTLVCIGGPLVSSNPVEMMKISNADIAVMGEGEITFLDICQGKPLNSVKGIVYRNGKYIKSNEPQSLIENLDEIPFPAYDLLPDFRIYKSRARKKPVGVIMTSRGCPYSCTYCNSSVFGKKFRARSPENVLQEIDMLINDYRIRQLDVLDDNFTLNVERAEKIIDLLCGRKYRLLINLQNGVRADRLTYPLIKKMRKAGVFKVGIGVESGDKDTLIRIRKALDLAKVTQAIGWFRKEKIITIGFFMLGFPDDTKESIERTIEFAKKCNPTLANFSILIPFPGTAIYSELKNRNLLKSKTQLFYDSGFYSTGIYFKPKSLSEKELLFYQKKAYNDFMFRISKMIEVILSIRSWGELKWTFEAAMPFIKRLLGMEKTQTR